MNCKTRPVYWCMVLLISVAAQSPQTLPKDLSSDADTLSLYTSYTFCHPLVPGNEIQARVKVLYSGNAITFKAECPEGPVPLVVFLSGASVEPNRYQWLGERLVSELGVAWVVVDLLLSLPQGEFLVPMPGGITDPQEPNPGLVGLFRKLREIDNGHVFLKGCLDVDNVILGGHSWGGRVALVDGSNKGFFPNVVGAFIYGAHAERVPGPGFVPRTMLPLEGPTPLLIMFGLDDMVLGETRNSTFESGLEGVRYLVDNANVEDRMLYYIEFEDFNHAVIIDPEDKTRPSARLEPPSTNKTEKLEVFYDVVSLFVQKYALNATEAATDFNVYLSNGDNPYISNFTIRG